MKMGTGIGAWLGPVGGYGQSGEYRRAYWRSKGGMQLSNEDYYNFFIRCCTNMIDRYGRRLPGLQFNASLAMTSPLNLPAPGRCQALYFVFQIRKAMCFC